MSNYISTVPPSKNRKIKMICGHKNVQLLDDVPDDWIYVNVTLEKGAICIVPISEEEYKSALVKNQA